MTPASMNPTCRRSVGAALVAAVLVSSPWAVARAQVEMYSSTLRLFDFSTFRPSDTSRRVAAADGPTTNDGEGGALREAERKRAVTTAVLLLGGILFVGAMMIVLIVLWGFRVRRLARKPLPSGTAADPLWYLRGRQDRLHGGGDSAKAATRGKTSASSVGPPTSDDRPEAIDDDDDATDPGIEGDST